jgi:uncharacterized protein DUF6600
MMGARILRTYLCIFFPFITIASALPAFAQEYPSGKSDAAAENPPYRIARLSFIQGNVSFLRAGVEQWAQASLNFPVTTGDRLYTEKGARAELEIGQYTVRLADATDITVTNLNDEIIQLGLEQGTLRVTVHEFRSGDTVEIDTPNGALTLLASGSYRVEADASGSRTIADVNAGQLEITGGSVVKQLQAGQAAKLTGNNPINIETIPLPPLDRFDNWCEERDLRLSSSKSSKYVSRGIPGFEELDDYGTWEDVPEYGPVWYPAGVAVEWVPYRFGRWVWVGPWGWTWIEDEPWGFCQFHYGRWAHIGVAWGWVPGPIVPLPVYAPAFVAFVGGPGFSISVGVGGAVGLAAWFPLGPGEPFFPWYHYGGDYLRVVNITNIHVTDITRVINVTNVNNIDYAYRTVAATAVRADVFRSGQPIARNVVHVPPERLERAQVVPHPNINPMRQAVLPGKPVSAPPVRPVHLATAPRPAAASVAKAAPPVNAARAPVAGSSPGPEPGPARSAEHLTTTSPPRLITRAPPPPMRMPFAQERSFMGAHPGRPLEPQQLHNVWMGRSAGPMLDREFPPHVTPVPRRAEQSVGRRK